MSGTITAAAIDNLVGPEKLSRKGKVYCMTRTNTAKHFLL